MYSKHVNILTNKRQPNGFAYKIHDVPYITVLDSNGVFWSSKIDKIQANIRNIDSLPSDTHILAIHYDNAITCIGEPILVNYTNITKLCDMPVDKRRNFLEKTLYSSISNMTDDVICEMKEVNKKKRSILSKKNELDNILCKFLNRIGYSNVVDVYRGEIEKIYQVK